MADQNRSEASGRPQGPLPEPIVIDCRRLPPEELLAREWLLTNRLGSYASSSICGANTRRYHGLLVAATRPPAGRILALNNVLDVFVCPDSSGRQQSFDLGTFEWTGKFAPDGRANLAEFRNDAAATLVFRCGPSTLVKEVFLAEGANVVAVRYRLTAGPGGVLTLRPFASLRDYHALCRTAQRPQFTYATADGQLCVIDPKSAVGALNLTVQAGTRHARFSPQVQWWNRFLYRGDVARGQEGVEDLYTPGWFEAPLTARHPVQLTAGLDELAVLDFDHAVGQKRRRLDSALAPLAGADLTTRRLAAAGDAFLASSAGRGRQGGPTILAGYHWFADWGRDAMVALPGLLLETGRFDEARAVLRTFAAAIDRGMVPNCFDEHAGPPHFNSFDASLWFVVAAWRYLQASDDRRCWQAELFPAIERILSAYRDGTRFNIHADADGLIFGGDANTQLTWMDVKWAGQAVTPRWGKPVEVNALWLAALRVAGRHAPEAASARRWGDLAKRAADNFGPAFWNESAGCLFDCVYPDGKDASIRPNQVVALALEDCPLYKWQQQSVLNVVIRDLLTPMGLRTLAPADDRYRGRCGASWESRDKAYHQGAVWPWLMGPFIEAYLRVHDFSPPARAQARTFLSGFDDLSRHGVGFLSEIADGDWPHQPAGCIAQAWSVGEVLRANRLVESP